MVVVRTFQALRFGSSVAVSMVVLIGWLYPIVQVRAQAWDGYRPAPLPMAQDAYQLAQRRGGTGREPLGGRREDGNEDRGASADSPAAADSPFAPDAPRELHRRAGLVKTGLDPIYPKQARCREVASHFADTTRYDGSRRLAEAYHGYHSGIDISAPEGTPLVAIADGVVTDKLEGGRLVGIQITLRHSPQDTGLPVWIYSKYRHLEEMPKLEAGDRVTMGQVIALSGKTGTVGGHYRVSGYPHLHMAVFKGTDQYFLGKGGAVPVDGEFLDPLAVFFGAPLDNHRIAALPADRKRFPIPYKTTDGRVVPEGTRLIWPFMCDPA